MGRERTLFVAVGDDIDRNWGRGRRRRMAAIGGGGKEGARSARITRIQ